MPGRATLEDPCSTQVKLVYSKCMIEYVTTGESMVR